jgi:hypothetical protein
MSQSDEFVSARLLRLHHELRYSARAIGRVEGEGESLKLVFGDRAGS